MSETPVLGVEGREIGRSLDLFVQTGLWDLVSKIRWRMIEKVL